jgi:hypothetical protein
LRGLASYDQADTREAKYDPENFFGKLQNIRLAAASTAV